MNNSIIESFHTLIDIGNIGKKDIERLEIILKALDEEGKISKKDAITITHPHSKNAERSYDNFINRIKKEIKDTYQDTDNIEYREMLSTMSIAHSNLLGKSHLVLKGKAIVKLQPTTSQNKTYSEEYYIDTTGDTSRDKEIFISYATANEGEKERFIDELNKVMKKKNIDYHLDLWEMEKIPIGISFHDEITKHLNKADYGFVLLSNDVMQSNYILDTEIPHLLTHNKIFPIGLVGDIDALNETIEKIQKKEQKKTAKALMDRNIQLSLERTFFDKCANASRREEFIESVISSLEHRMSFDKSIGTITLNNVVLNKAGYEGDIFYNSKGKRTKITHATQKTNQKDTTLSVKVQDDLKQWLADKKKALYALLGDYGMGKTFNLRMLSHYLYDIYKQDNTKPFPFYIDLRDVESFVTTVAGIKRVRTIEEFITEILRQSKNTHITADEIIQMHRSGSLILILDGLDEKLVHYNKEEQKTFFREIVSVMTYNINTEYATKTILSCRNHYFKTTTDQNNFLLGSNRTNLGSDDYTSLNMLPLESQEMLAFLKKRVSHDEAERIMLYVNDEEYLGSIASRPFMLGKIIDLLPQLTKLKAQDKSINTATFYEALIKDTLGRDEEKHFIEERHKYTILKSLAYYMFDNNTQSLSVNRLNDWFEDFIADTPRLARRYSLKDDGHILEKDLRNSTLLVRFGDEDFGFSHSSIAEYFLARYILEHYDTTSQGKEPSTLTHTMILETADGFSKEDKQILFPKVINCAQEGDSYWVKLSIELLCKLQLDIESLKLSKLDLRDFNFENLNITKLSLRECDLFSASWKKCNIKEFNIKGTSISENYFSYSTINKFYSQDSLTTDITAYKSELSFNSTFNYDNPPKYPFLNFIHTKNTNGVHSVTYSPDGKTLLSGSVDNTLRLWDIYSGKCIYSLKGHSDYIRSVAYSPDGKTLVSASADNTIRLWDIYSSKCLYIFSGHTQPIYSISYSPDGRTLLSGSADNTLRLWDISNKKCIHLLEGHSNSIRSVAYSPDGETLLSGASDNTIRLWNIHSGECMNILKGHNYSINSVIYSHDGKTIFSGSSDRTIRIWDVVSNKCLYILYGHTSCVHAIAYNPNDKTILTGSTDNTLRIWDTCSGECIHIIEGNNGYINSVAYSPNFKTLLSGSSDGNIKIYDINSKKLTKQMAAEKNQWCSLDYINKTAKGTSMSWRYVSLEHNNEQYYFSDMKGFEVCE